MSEASAPPLFGVDKAAAWEARLADVARRKRWVEIDSVSREAIADGASKNFVLVNLARGALLGRESAVALRLLDQMSAVAAKQTKPVQIRVQALLELQRHEEAQAHAERHLVVHPDDLVMQRLLSRIKPVKPSFLGVQPLESLERAKLLVKAGRYQSALRLLRVLAALHPEEPRLNVAVRNVERRLNSAAATWSDPEEEEAT